MATIACKRHAKAISTDDATSPTDKKWFHSFETFENSTETIIIPASNKEKLKVCFPTTDDDVNCSFLTVSRVIE